MGVTPFRKYIWVDLKRINFTLFFFSLIETKMPRYTACYDAYLYFVVPKSVSEYLLEEYDVKNDGKAVGSWWIRHGTFYYIDKDGNRQEIEHEPEQDIDYKRPSGDVMIDDCDDGEDEDEE